MNLFNVHNVFFTVLGYPMSYIELSAKKKAVYGGKVSFRINDFRVPAFLKDTIINRPAIKSAPHISKAIQIGFDSYSNKNTSRAGSPE